LTPVMSHLSRLRSNWGAPRHQHCKYDHNENERSPLDGRITGRTRACGFDTLQYDGLRLGSTECGESRTTGFRTPLLPLTRHRRSARLFANRTVAVEVTVIIRRTRSPEIRWGRDPPNDGTANGSADVNNAPNIRGLAEFAPEPGTGRVRAESDLVSRFALLPHIDCTRCGCKYACGEEARAGSSLATRSAHLDWLKLHVEDSRARAERAVQPSLM
jgi:hypothetical protein